YRAPERAGDSFPLVNVQANPAKAPGRGGIVLPIEDGRWLVTLGGTRGGEPTADPDAFARYALALDDPVIGELIEHAEPLTDVFTTRSTANHRRYYEKMKRWPDGFTVLGDAVAAYNPVYGHGLTVAAQGALAVRDTLRSTGLTAPGTARRLQRAASRPVAAAWDLAVGQDVFYPGATDTPPTAAERLLARFVDRAAAPAARNPPALPATPALPPTAAGRFLARFVDRAVAPAARNPRAMSALLDVMSMEKPATRLFSPDMLIPMLFGPKKPHLDRAPLTEAERKAALP